VIAALIAFALVLPATALAVWLVLGWLRKKQVLDIPNERSSHSLPTPRGGGLAVTPICLAAWALLAWLGEAPITSLWVAAGGLGLLVLSWLDDRHNLPAAPRLALHACACIIGLAALPSDALILQGWLPFWADRLVALLGYVWFVNLYNFMDGVDGITGVETACVALGLTALAVVFRRVEIMGLSLTLVAAAIGFLIWNWHPAKLFLGDSGSVPLGYLLGWLLLDLAGHGELIAALILPLYYLADATITLGRRAVRGEKVWQAHREHFYQQAVKGGEPHDRVVLTILGANMLLMVLAHSTVWAGYRPLVLAVLLVAALLRHFAKVGKGES